MTHLKNLFKKIMQDPTTSQGTKDDLQTMWDSHLRRGEKLQFQGLLREAIQEYEKEMERPIKSAIDAEIVESAFWQMGNAHRQLGETEQAVAAYEKALDLFRQYRVGVWPHGELAELYLEQKRVDEAIAVCEECLKQANSPKAREVLAQAVALKSGGSKQSTSS